MKSAWIASFLIAAACEKVGPGLAPAGGACAPGEARGALTWIEDDLAGAEACAKQRGVPVVVDLWAPWCHTCRSMSQYVLSDPAFAPFADRFVFAGIDTDKPANAAVTAALPQSVWPTYFVISPDDGAIESRFEGAATIAQWKEFLAAGETAYASASLGPNTPIAYVRDGDRAMVAHDYAAADRAYGAALAAAPRGWPRRADVLVSQIGARWKANDTAGCLDLGLRGLDDTGRSSSVTDFLTWALRCADAREKDEPARVAEMRTRAAARLLEITNDPHAPLSVDDRSDALANLRELDDQLGDHAAALAAAEKQRVLLDDAFARAPSPAAAATFDYQRADVYVYLGRGADVVGDLEASIAALPDDYDPPYRLAGVLLSLHRLDEATRYIDRAASLSYGPRKGRVLALAADIANAKGDRARERALRQQIVDLYASLPAGQVSADTIAKAKQRLDALNVN